MSLWESVKSWFRSESTEAREWSGDLQRDLSADLDRKEADLQASPAEKIESLQDQISGNTNTIDEIKGRIETTGIDPETDESGGRDGVNP